MYTHLGVFCNTELRHTLAFSLKKMYILELPKNLMINVNYLADSFCTCHLIDIAQIRDAYCYPLSKR